MIFLFISITASFGCFSNVECFSNKAKLTVSKDVTAWSGEDVTLNCSVEMDPDNHDQSVIIWIRHQDNAPNDDYDNAEVIAHDEHVLVHSENDRKRFQVSTIKNYNKTISSLTVYNTTESDTATFSCILSDNISGELDNKSVMLVIFSKLDLNSNHIGNQDSRERKHLSDLPSTASKESCITIFTNILVTIFIIIHLIENT